MHWSHPQSYFAGLLIYNEIVGSSVGDLIGFVRSFSVADISMGQVIGCLWTCPSPRCSPCPTGPVERGLDFHPRALQKTSPGAMLLFLRSQEILHNISSGKLWKNSSAPYIYPLISFKWARKCPRLPIKTWGFVEATDGLPHRGLGKWIERQCGGHKFIPPTLFSASWV